MAANIKYWLYLFGAVVFEVAGTSVMKLSQSGTWLLGAHAGLAVMLALIGLSYYCLSLSVRGLPIGVAYAFWEGLGLTLITLVSVLALGEAMNAGRFAALAAILCGALLVNHGTGHGTGHGTAHGDAGRRGRTDAAGETPSDKGGAA